MLRKFFHIIIIFTAFTLITGVIYPVAVKILASAFFPYSSSGKIIVKDDKAVGSELIAQNFESNKYFHPRPSSTGYSAMPSGASNLAQSSIMLKKLFYGRRQSFCEENFINSTDNIPAEMLFASASGVDPDISPESAFMQADRVAKARNFNLSEKNKLMALINKMIEKPGMGFIGMPRVNVLLLNIELDKIK